MSGMFQGTQIDTEANKFGGSSGESDAFKDRLTTGLGDSGQQVGAGASGLSTAGAYGSSFVDAGRNRTAQADARGLDHRGLAGGLSDQLAGFQSSAPNVGSMVGQQMLDQGRAQALSIASAGRGGNRAAALRGALEANTSATAQASSQAQITAAQQQMAAEQMQLGALQAAAQQRMGLAGMEGQIAGQGIGMQQNGAGLRLGAGQSLANLGAGREANYLSTLSGVGALEANLGTQTAITQAQIDEAAKQRGLDFAGSIIQGGASVAGGF